MYSESPWSRKTIGDVDVFYHDGLYHLFHLVLPNHDFIAHAVGDNGLNRRRVDNALFIGNPGSWDDLMLWTMHVSEVPHHEGRWRMFYTGLSRRDQGRKQRIGMAISDDLFHWRKTAVAWKDLRGETDPDLVKRARRQLQSDRSDQIHAPYDKDSCFPLEPDPNHYESSADNERNWVSFRDPFYFRDTDRSWLLMAARIREGPVVRRGCVGAMRETSPNHFSTLPPLHIPKLYDDIEVPNLFKIDGDYYLIGSIREDSKIRYWHTDQLSEPWRTYSDNVVLPKGNYAGRVCSDASGVLLFNFYTQRLDDGTVHNLLPPPKRIERRENGQLQAITFEGLHERIEAKINTGCLRPLKDSAFEPDFDHQQTFCRMDGRSLQLVSKAGFQAFVFDQEVDCFRLRTKLSLQGAGKCGIVSRIDAQSHDGYYLSLNLLKGISQFRSWRTGDYGAGENMMQFDTLQEGNWRTQQPQDIDIQLIAFGSYHEFCVDGAVVLSLANSQFSRGLLGFYVESADLRIENLELHKIKSPTQSDEHLSRGWGDK